MVTAVVVAGFVVAATVPVFLVVWAAVFFVVVLVVVAAMTGVVVAKVWAVVGGRGVGGVDTSKAAVLLSARCRVCTFPAQIYEPVECRLCKIAAGLMAFV